MTLPASGVELAFMPLKAPRGAERALALPAAERVDSARLPGALARDGLRAWRYGGDRAGQNGSHAATSLAVHTFSPLNRPSIKKSRIKQPQTLQLLHMGLDKISE